jgi:glutaredoxin
LILIYGKEKCSWCEKAKNLAIDYGLEFEYKDTGEWSNMEELFIRKPDTKTVPQIWWDERYIGGFEKFAEEVENTIGDYGNGQV